MKLTDKQLELFKALSESQIGKDLVEYYDALIDHVCNSRYWGENDTKESTQKVAKILQENLIDKIRLQSKPKTTDKNQFL